MRALAEARGLLDSLLEVSKLDAGAIEVATATFDLSALLREVCDSFSPAAAERGITIGLRVGKEVQIFARTDALLVRRILHNLVDNAIKFTAAGSITLEANVIAGNYPESISLRVCDTGLGVPVEMQERIFEEFYQVANTERNRSKGLGLGLAIVRRLAVLLGAKVKLTSSLGGGSAFEIVLPGARMDVPPAPVTKLVGRGTTPTSLVRHSVLVVVDERDIRESLQTFLSTVGWKVAVASDQEGALSLVGLGFAPDAIIVDFRLREGASGLEALDALRRLGCTAPAWLITGDTEPTRIAAARAAGVPVIYKPVDGQELLALINAALMPSARDGQRAPG